MTAPSGRDFELRAQSWGVEFEFVLAFHRRRLERIFNAYEDSRRPKIVSQHEVDHDSLLKWYNDDLALRDAGEGRAMWPSWVMEVPGDDVAWTLVKEGDQSDEIPAISLDWSGYVHRTLGEDSAAHQTLIHRTYCLEPLLIAQDVLQLQGLDTDVVGRAIHISPKIQVPAQTNGSQSHGGIITWERRPPVLETFRRNNREDAQATRDSAIWRAGLKPAIILISKLNLKYEQWMLTRDSSVIGATKKELKSALQISADEAKDWDSDSIELVSRQFEYSKLAGGCEEIAKYLSVLRNGRLPDATATEQEQHEAKPDWQAIQSVFAGTHVHIGMNWKSKNDADPWFIRHLAFIVLGNEELISSLHPWQRRGKYNDFSPVDVVFPQIKRRRTSADERDEEELRVAELTGKYVPKHTLQSNTKRFDEKTGCRTTSSNNEATNAFNRYRVTAWADIAHVCFSNRTSLTALFNTIQAKFQGIASHGVLVDFSRLKRFMGYEDEHFSDEYKISQHTAPTIEFRQHSCSLDADDISRWVRFLFAIVHLAERHAHTAPPQLEFITTDEVTAILAERLKYPTRGIRTYHPHTIQDLCGPKMLNLSDDDTTYWIARHKTHQRDNMHYIAHQIARRHNRQNKPKFALPLTPQQIQALPPAPAQQHYTAKPTPTLRAELKERFNLEPRSAFDKKAIQIINTMSKKQLVNMAVESDANLRRYGTYTQQPTQRMKEEGKRYRIPCSRSVFQYEGVKGSREVTRRRYVGAGRGLEREVDGLRVWGWDPVKVVGEGLL